MFLIVAQVDRGRRRSLRRRAAPIANYRASERTTRGAFANCIGVLTVVDGLESSGCCEHRAVSDYSASRWLSRADPILDQKIVGRRRTS